MNAWHKELEQRIRDAYYAASERNPKRSRRGWRFLYSPAAVLEGAHVAFIGINPGGDAPEEERDGLFTEAGSAFETECWGTSEAGESNLQRRVRVLFNLLDVSADAVLAGNLVPFRSPSWKKDKHAEKFGRELWADVFERARPKIVITHGNPSMDNIKEVLGIETTQEHQTELCSGKDSYATIVCGHNDTCEMVALPHLSRSPIVTNKDSKPRLCEVIDNVLKRAHSRIL